MTARCSSRVRRKPTPIYQVEDTRVSNEEVEEEVGASDELLTNGQGDDSSDSGPDRDDEEFKPSKSKIARSKDTRSTPRTPGTKVPKVNTHRRKRSPWSQARSVKSADRPKKRSKRSAPTEDNEDVLTSGNDDTRDVSLYESIKSGKASLEKVLTKWRGRFEEDDEAAMREVLNVVMQAFGSNQCVPDTEPLAQLDMGEMVNHVLEDLESGNGEYLLMSRGRSMKKCQQNFEEFWDVFVMECYESEILFTSNVASNFVDWLTTLSSSELRPIRHTATVAVLAMSNALVHVAASISNQLAISTRQLSAEISSPSAGKNSTNLQKMAVLKDIKALSEDRLEQVLKLVNLIFTGVVVHRYRDVMPEIRADNFVKYLGWLLSDKSALVRLEVVEILCELYENDAFTERLELFNSRFMPRFLELCNDVDAAVVEASIHLLIAADKHSLISSDVDLSPVEKLVFDAQRENIRRAAAEFVCLQYDAFGVAVSKTKSAQLKKEQLNTQAIALTEFAEEYINNHDVPESAVETLVDAFWGLDDCLVIQDWRLMTDLLLVDKSAPDLSSKQQTILLRLLVASISKLVKNTSNRGGIAAAKRKPDQLQEEITVAYCKDIPSLFLLYQADLDKLPLLLRLIPMLSLKSDVIGHQSGHIKELLEKLKHAFLLHTEEGLLSSLSLSISHMLRTEHASLKREVEVIMHELVEETMNKIDRLLASDMKLFDATIGNDKITKMRHTRKKTNTPAVNEISDVEYALCVALCRLKCLMRYFDLREYLPPDLSAGPENSDLATAQQERFDKLVTAMENLLCSRTKSVSKLHEGFANVDIIKHALAIIYSDLLWITSPVFKAIEEAKKRNSIDNMSHKSEPMADPIIQCQVQKVCRLRSTLENALICTLGMHLARTNTAGEHKENNDLLELRSLNSMEEIEFEHENVAAYVRDVQRFAFLTFCDTRCLFVEKFRDATAPYSELDWNLPKVLVLLTQMYFEKEMDNAEEEEPEFEDGMLKNNPEVAKERIDMISDWKQKQQRKAELLVALGRVSLCNPNKKHQAAAVLQHFTSGGKSCVEVVKAFGKQVKSDAPVRYLEIQMTALRQMFNSILVWKQEINAGKAGNTSDQVMEEDLEEKVESSEQELKELAKRFSQSLGVGKISASLRAPFLRFVREGIRFSLEQPTHFEFLQVMRVYLSHLDDPSLVQLREYFMDRLQTVRDIPDNGDLDPKWKAVFDFQTSISSNNLTSGRMSREAEMMKSPPLKSKRRSASSEPTPMQAMSIAEEDEEDSVKSDHDAGSDIKSAAGEECDPKMVQAGTSKEVSDHIEQRPLLRKRDKNKNEFSSPRSGEQRKRLRTEKPNGVEKVFGHDEDNSQLHDGLDNNLDTTQSTQETQPTNTNKKNLNRNIDRRMR